MIKIKVAFSEDRLFFNQSEIFEYFLNCSDCLDKSRPSKKPLLFWSCKQAINDLLFTKMPQQKTASWSLNQYHSLIYRVVKLSNFLRTPFGNVINVMGKLFCKTNH